MRRKMVVAYLAHYNVLRQIGVDVNVSWFGVAIKSKGNGKAARWGEAYKSKYIDRDAFNLQLLVKVVEEGETRWSRRGVDESDVCTTLSTTGEKGWETYIFDRLRRSRAKIGGVGSASVKSDVGEVCVL